ncbi:MAG TPA: hypothetical protein VGD10_03445 [Allosphingosinicella sp.]|uniref:hypothetical protein n=1 Tax=Allosphingosinicella sp. TaxID=2823234 RepID=UPI002ED9071E
MQHTRSALLAALVTLSGCAPIDRGFGEALRWDLAQQVIDPDPSYEGEEMEGGSGEHAADAVDRYYKGTVKQPATLGTSSSGGQPKQN